MTSKAFTLIELLIVVAIIAILAAIAVPNFLEAQTRAKVSRTKGDMRTIGIALESYRVDSADYPPTSWQRIPGNFTAGSWFLYVIWAAPVAGPSGQVTATCYWSCLTSPVSYLASIPFDTFETSWAMRNSVSIWGANYIISQASVIYGTRDKAPMDALVDGKRYKSAGCFLSSIGPSLINASGYDSPAGGDNNPNAPCLYYFTSYDPTNGSTSLGMLTWFGAGIGLRP
jgi:prepilin-type N-terminal cleavage/methylation domain-containing protein